MMRITLEKINEEMNNLRDHLDEIESWIKEYIDTAAAKPYEMLGELELIELPVERIIVAGASVISCGGNYVGIEPIGHEPPLSPRLLHEHNISRDMTRQNTCHTKLHASERLRPTWT